RSRVETRNVPTQSYGSQPTVIEVDGNPGSVEFVFKSSSSRIRARQQHSGGGAGQTEETSSNEEPTRLVHTVTKPIIQEVREIITPFRKIVQGLFTIFHLAPTL